MKQYCWCSFNYKKYGLQFDDLVTINEFLVEKSAENFFGVGVNYENVA